MRVRGLKNSIVTASLGEKERMPEICIFSIVVDMVAIDGERQWNVELPYH